MHIFADESGTFSASEDPASFCVVTSYVVPERSRKLVEKCLIDAKLEAGFRASDEVKAKNLGEPRYFAFLESLGKLEGTVLATATNMALNQNAARKKEEQAVAIEANIPRMLHEEGRSLISALAMDVRRLSDQQFVELSCRAHMVWDVIRLATLYYVQRVPATLSAFRWVFDQKDKKPNHFEKAFTNLLTPLTQTLALSSPFQSLEGADYSKFERFYRHGPAPEWLPAQAHEGDTGMLIDANKVWYEHLKFVDSTASLGVQIADLVSNGILRCLRGRFADNERAAELLGRLMVVRERGMPPLGLLSLADAEATVAPEVARVIKLMKRHTRPMLA